MTKILRNRPNVEAYDKAENAVKEIVRKDYQKNCKRTIFNMNWNHRRSIAGYYGCGDCDLCKVSKGPWQSSHPINGPGDEADFYH